MQRKARTIIPDFAIREVVVNAIVHRDYSMTGASVKIHIFDDRLMVRIFRKMNFMEELGTGIARILELYGKKGLRRPTFSEQGQYFKAVLPQVFELESNQEKVFELLRSRDVASASQLAESLEIHHNTVLKILNQLIKAGKARKTGSGKNTRYKIIY